MRNDQTAARITLSIAEDGAFALHLNPAGRDQLVQALQALDAQDEHFHLSPDDWSEIKVKTIPYQSTDRVLEHGKVYLRLDDWDRQFAPHVMAEESEGQPENR